MKPAQSEQNKSHQEMNKTQNNSNIIERLAASQISR